MGDSVPPVRAVGGTSRRATGKRPPTQGLDFHQLAVLEMDPEYAVSGHLCSREVAVAYPDGRPTLAWLVAPSAAWTSAEINDGPSTILAAKHVPPGRGLYPAVVAREITAALEGHTVLAVNPPSVRRYMRGVFVSVGSAALPFKINDLFSIVRRLKARQFEIEEAGTAANHSIRAVQRPTAEAARHALFLQALETRVKARIREAGQKEEISLERRSPP